MTQSELCNFLKDLMRRLHRSRAQLAADLGVSHPTVLHWLSGKDIPSTCSCRKLAEYSGVPVAKIFSMAGHLPQLSKTVPGEWPEFHEYAQLKYPEELDEDLIAAIEGFIERRRRRRCNGRS